jgi:ABC-2 type transport system permease protein
VTFIRVLRAEWIKFWSLRSTWWILGSTVVVTIGFAAIEGWGLNTAHTMTSGSNQGMGGPNHAKVMAEISSLQSTDVLIQGTIIAQIVIAILGILLITNEYSSGMIRSTLATVPRRNSVLWTKALVIGIIAFVLSFVASWIGLIAGAPIIRSIARNNEFTSEAWHVTTGIALSTALIVIFALAVGALLRNGGAAIGIVMGVLFVLSTLLTALPWRWTKDIGEYMPNVAGQVLYTLKIDTTTLLDFWPALLVAVAWAFIPLIAATVLLKKRDA